MAAAGSLAQTHYRVGLSPDLRDMTVRVCFESAPTRSLRAGDAAAARYVSALRFDDENRTVRRLRSRRVNVANVAAGECLTYDVAIGRAADRGELRRNAWVGGDVLTTPEVWLLRDGEPFEIEFALPAGINVSAPWPPLPTSTTRPLYRGGDAPVAWAAIVAFGRFTPRTVALGEAGATLTLLDEGRFERPKDIEYWLAEAAAGVSAVYGVFPRSSSQWLVVPSARGDSVVPWAQVLRGGAPAAHFFVNPNKSLDEFRADWTASHELSHLLLPFVSRDDAWLSEGFASYYQNVSRARIGLQTPAATWDKLQQGFARGVAGTRSGSLRSASRRMRASSGYMRVYWSGAAIALLADVHLRRRSANARSLDTTLASLQSCCLAVDKVWRASELMTKLDELSDSDVFTTLLRQHIDSARFPDVAPVLRELGVDGEPGKTRLDDEAPLADVREKIMAQRVVQDAP